MKQTVQHVQAKLEALEVQDWQIKIMSKRGLRKLAKECGIHYPLLLKHIKIIDEFERREDDLSDEMRERLVELEWLDP